MAGILCALWIDPETAAQLAVPGGEPAERLHVTITYSEMPEPPDELTIMRFVGAIDRVVSYRPGLEGEVSGYGRFGEPGDTEEPHVFYASVDIPRLEELRQEIVNALFDRGITVCAEHGYTPHITLQYLSADAPNPADQVPSLPLAFTGVTVAIGERRIAIPFWATGGATANPVTMAMSAPATDVPDMQSTRPMLFEASQEWIAFLPKPGQYHHSVFDLNLTADKYAQMLSHFKAGTYVQDVPINVEHDSRAAGAVGWLRDMRIAEDGSLEVKPEWNDRGRALLEGDRFRYVSAEWAETWQDPVSGEWHQNVPMGLAITTHPHLKPNVLKPLAMSEDVALGMVRALAIPDANGKDSAVPNEQETTPQSAATTLTQQPTQHTLVEMVQLQDAVRRKDSQITTLSGQITTLNERIAQLETERDTERRERLSDWAKAEVLGLSADNGQAWLGDPELNTKMLIEQVTLSGGNRNAQLVRWTVDQKRAEARAMKASEAGLFDPVGAGGREPIGSVESTVKAMADAKRRANPALSEAAATNAVYEENPDLYVRHLNGR